LFFHRLGAFSYSTKSITSQNSQKVGTKAVAFCGRGKALHFVSPRQLNNHFVKSVGLTAFIFTAVRGDIFIKLIHVTYFALTHKVIFYTLLIEKGNCCHYYCLKRKEESKCMED
jgi:hypothetical protein